MSSYPGRSRVTREMANIIGSVLSPYVDTSERPEHYTSEEDWVIYETTRWADERAYWDIKNQKVFLEGFPYWFRVEQAKAEEEMNAKLRPFVNAKKEAILAFIDAEYVAFETRFGCKVDHAIVPDRLIGKIRMANTNLFCNYQREEYGKALILYSGELEGHYRKISIPETL